jgi:hypothetical protein
MVLAEGINRHVYASGPDGITGLLVCPGSTDLAECGMQASGAAGSEHVRCSLRVMMHLGGPCVGKIVF